MSLRAAALVAVSLLLLAGCAAKPPTGEFKPTTFAPAVSGSVVTVFQPFAGANPASQAPPPANGPTQCAQNNATDPTGGQIPPGTLPAKCKGPYTTFALHADGLPMGSGSGYKLYAVGPGFEYEVCTVQIADTKASCTANNTKADMENQVKGVELRMDGFPFAMAKVPGNQTLVVNPAIAALKVEGSYKGHDLMVTVTGLPANATYKGKLYVADAASPTGFTAKETFDLKEGMTMYTSAEHNIADFAQFHIHVGDSALNLYKADLQTLATK